MNFLEYAETFLASLGIIYDTSTGTISKDGGYYNGSFSKDITLTFNDLTQIKIEGCLDKDNCDEVTVTVTINGKEYKLHGVPFIEDDSDIRWNVFLKVRDLNTNQEWSIDVYNSKEFYNILKIDFGKSNKPYEKEKDWTIECSISDINVTSPTILALYRSLFTYESTPQSFEQKTDECLEKLCQGLTDEKVISFFKGCKSILVGAYKNATESIAKNRNAFIEQIKKVISTKNPYYKADYQQNRLSSHCATLGALSLRSDFFENRLCDYLLDSVVKKVFDILGVSYCNESYNFEHNGKALQYKSGNFYTFGSVTFSSNDGEEISICNDEAESHMRMGSVRITLGELEFNIFHKGSGMYDKTNACLLVKDLSSDIYYCMQILYSKQFDGYFKTNICRCTSGDDLSKVPSNDIVCSVTGLSTEASSHDNEVEKTLSNYKEAVIKAVNDCLGTNCNPSVHAFFTRVIDDLCCPAFEASQSIPIYYAEALLDDANKDYFHACLSLDRAAVQYVEKARNILRDIVHQNKSANLEPANGTPSI